MAACIQVKSKLIWLLVKKFIIVKNATAYTWDWYCHLVVDRASFIMPPYSVFKKSFRFNEKKKKYLKCCKKVKTKNNLFNYNISIF
jgi:hypothetical protein